MKIKAKYALICNDAHPIVENPVLEIKDEKIVSIATASHPSVLAEGDIDLGNCLLMPGLINSHTHSAMSLLRGYAEDLSFHEWLFKKIFPVEQKYVTPEFVHLGSLVSMMEMLKSGTTTFNDMYFFAEQTARASQEVGLRGVCALTYIHNNSIEPIANLRNRCDSYLDVLKQYPLQIAALGPHAIYTIPTAELEKIIALAAEKNLRLHIHVSETVQENENCVKEHGKTPTEYLKELGLWKLKTTAAHACCLTENDIQILGEHKVGIAHNPESNLKLGTRIAPLVALKKAGAHLGIGTDSCASNNNLDLFQEMDFASKLQMYREGAGKWTTRETVHMATLSGARALYLDRELGSLEPGKKADFIAIDLSSPHATPLYDPYYHVVFSGNGADVKHAWVNGKWVLKDKKITTIDEEAILIEARKVAKFIQKGV